MLIPGEKKKLFAGTFSNEKRMNSKGIIIFFIFPNQLYFLLQAHHNSIRPNGSFALRSIAAAFVRSRSGELRKTCAGWEALPPVMPPARAKVFLQKYEKIAGRRPRLRI